MFLKLLILDQAFPFVSLHAYSQDVNGYALALIYAINILFSIFNILTLMMLVANLGHTK